jgi:hypothetical protein
MKMEMVMSDDYFEVGYNSKGTLFLELNSHFRLNDLKVKKSLGKQIKEKITKYNKLNQWLFEYCDLNNMDYSDILDSLSGTNFIFK